MMFLMYNFALSNRFLTAGELIPVTPLRVIRVKEKPC
jgi:hypothetical protein